MTLYDISHSKDMENLKKIGKIWKIFGVKMEIFS